jgi:hypothetical protein
MLEITPEQVTPALEALFPTTGFVVGHRCFSVLAGTRAGRIFADDPATPRWGAVQELPFETVFLGGTLDEVTVAALWDIFRQDGEVSFGALPGNPYLELLPPGADDTAIDLDFSDRDPAVDLEHLAQPPAGLQLRRIDHDLLARCQWGELMVDMAGGAEQALTRGLGYCLMRGEEILSEANAGPVARGVIELGTITHPEQRGRGYATIVSARTALECERLGYDTRWNCAKDNPPSATIARRLGYRSEQEFRLLVWPKASSA